MFKSIKIRIVALLTIFSAQSIYAAGSSHKQNVITDEKIPLCLEGLKFAENLPTSDERFKFTSAIMEALLIRDALQKERESEVKLIEKQDKQIQDILSYQLTYKNERELNRGIQLIEPFLKSHNKKIKLCAEQTVRAFKSEITVYNLIRTPNTQKIEQDLAMSKSLDDFEQQGESLTDFFLSCLD